MKLLFNLATLLLLAGSTAANVFDNDTHPSTNQANGRRAGRLGSITPGASKADCAAGPLDIRLYADSSSSIRFHADPRSCVSGRAFSGSSGDGHKHVTLVPSRSGDGTFAASVTDDESGVVYSIGADADGDMVVVERMQEDYGEELDPEDPIEPAERALIQSRLSNDNTIPTKNSSSLRGGQIANQLKSLGDDFLNANDDRRLQSGPVMDVLVVWTSNAECRNAGRSRGCARDGTTAQSMLNRIDLAVQETKDAYSLSGVQADLNLADARWIDYTESSNDAFGSALSALRGTADGNMDIVHTWREETGADMVALIIDDAQYCGIAYLGPRIDLMFSVTAWNCATGYYSFGHELGHNQGCNHDKGTTGACSNSNYNYGFRDPQAGFRSILAYNCVSGQCDGNAGGGCTRVKRFSNDEFLYNSKAIGSAAQDNARQISDVAGTVAGYYELAPVVPTTSPTKQPTNSPTLPQPTTSPTPAPTNSPTSVVPKYICTKNDPGFDNVCTNGDFLDATCSAQGTSCGNGGKSCYIEQCPSSGPSPPPPSPPSPPTGCPVCGNGDSCCPEVGTCAESGKPDTRQCILF